jgi:hypothetical protein
MAYKKIEIKGKGKDTFKFTGMYIGKFERIGINQLKLIDERRTSKGSQLKNSFQLWHSTTNQYYLKILNKNSIWQVVILNSVDELRKWIANDERYDRLAAYAAKIHDLEPYAVPKIENLSKFKKQKVRSEKWRPPLRKNKDSNDGGLEIDMGDVCFYGFSETLIERFTQSTENREKELEIIKKTLKK